jgi:hypothetical protein
MHFNTLQGTNYAYMYRSIYFKYFGRFWWNLKQARWLYYSTVHVLHSHYWLLSRGGIVQSVPSNGDHLLIYCPPHLNSNHSRFTYHSSLLWFQQRPLAAKHGETGREMTTEFCVAVSPSYLKGFYHTLKSYDMGPTALLTLKMKLGYRILSLMDF